MSTVRVRYIVNAVGTFISYYCQHLDFHKELQPAPIFTTLSRGDLRHLLNAPSGVGAAVRPS
jgi:hypothetical protein